MKIVLDTSVVSFLMRRERNALERLSHHAAGDVVLSSPVAAEIRFGLERLQSGSRRQRLLAEEYDRLRALVRWSDWTEPAALEFGRQKALLERKGDVIEDMDVAIGSLAIVLDATLATGNVRHLARLDGLRLEDWSGP